MGISPQHIVVALPDSLRADTVNPAEDLPYLEKNGVWFTHARTPGCWTLPATASLFTGLMPHEHGADARTRRGLRSDVPTLAQLLHDSGFATYQVTANTATTEPFGLDRGFDRVVKAWQHIARRQPMYEAALSIVSKRRIRDRLFDLDHDYVLRRLSEDLGSSRVWWQDTADIVCNEARSIVERHRAQGARSFVFMNFMEAHFPYRLGAPLATSEGGLYASLREYAALYKLVNQTWLKKGEMTIDAEMLVRLRRRQRLAWQRLAPKINAFVEEMSRHSDTLIVFMSDHGDCFGEDRTAYHFGNVTEGGNRVPLAWIDPERRAPAMISTAVSSRNVFHAILAAAGVEEEGVLFDEQQPLPVMQAQWYDMHGATHPEYRKDQFAFVDAKGTPWMWRDDTWHEASHARNCWYATFDRRFSAVEDAPMSREQRLRLRGDFGAWRAFAKRHA